VVGHDAVREQASGVSGVGFEEAAFEGVVVGGFSKEGHAADGAVEDVVDQPAGSVAGFSGHGVRNLSASGGKGNSSRPLSAVLSREEKNSSRPLYCVPRRGFERRENSAPMPIFDAPDRFGLDARSERPAVPFGRPLRWREVYDVGGAVSMAERREEKEFTVLPRVTESRSWGGSRGIRLSRSFALPVASCRTSPFSVVAPIAQPYNSPRFSVSVRSFVSPIRLHARCPSGPARMRVLDS